MRQKLFIQCIVKHSRFIVLQFRSSGQTWLQLQQQKLRAKKELQHRGGDNDYYERHVHTDIRGRPLRY